MLFNGTDTGAPLKHALLSYNISHVLSIHIFEKIAKDEKAHYEFWVRITNRQIKAQKLVVWWYIFLVKIFGTSFALKSLEKRESGAEEFYKELFEI